MYRNGRNISDRLHIPDFTEQLFFCEYMVWMLRKEGQQIKFFCGKCFFFSIYPHTACCLIDLDAADLYDIILRHICADQTLITCHMCFDSRYQFTRAERFGHIVICSKSQSTDLINVIFLCGNHQNWRIFVISDFFTDLKSVHSRQHQVENVKIKFFFQGTFESNVSLALNLNFKSAQFQIIFLQLCNTLLIFYD